MLALSQIISRVIKIFCLPLFTLTGFHAYAQILELNSGWVCAPAARISSGGEQLSTYTYPVSGWMPATVPGTVLTTFLNNKRIPDPFYGLNNEQIPDISRTGRDYYTYWFIKDFKQAASNGIETWLNFRGVNYGCDVFLNGRKLNEKTHYGMFLRQSYNITSYLEQNGNNRLAVIIYPPDPVGNPNGGQGGDGVIAKNVTNQYVAGWDWIQPVRDRNTGIWDKVTIETTRGVRIKNPHFITRVPGVRLSSGKQEPATIRAVAEIENPRNQPVTGQLEYQLNGAVIKRDITVPAKSTVEITLPDYQLLNPRLWWPNGYGEQPLYKVNLQFIDNSRRILDSKTSSFGVRELRTRWNEQTKSRETSVNGQKIFIRGGNWIVSDAMLRLSEARYDAEIRFHRDMNLNLIRIWGGALTERPEFYAACDKYGMLVFQDFWFSGDCNGRWRDPMKKEDQATRRKYPDDHQLVLESLVDQLKMIRNHPSLAFYCGGNEITPPADILAPFKDSILPKVDATRYFFEYSNSDSMSLNKLGGNGDGPYNIQSVKTFWERRTWPFNSEVGSVGIGDIESLERFLPDSSLQSFPLYDKVDSVWKFHKYIGYDGYIESYGEVKNTRDFAWKAQLVNYDQYRGLIEGFSAHMWDWYTGVIIWKTQNPWTAMRGQMYDYYLDPNAGLYGLRKAGEPVHVMYNPSKRIAMVVNNGFDTKNSLLLEMKVFDINGKSKQIKKQVITADASSVKELADISAELAGTAKGTGVFLSMALTDAGKKKVSENLYWIPSEGNEKDLVQMPPAKLTVSTARNAAGKVSVTVKNAVNGPIAYFNRISLVDRQTKKRVLPVFYSDNYFSVLPGETKTIVIDYTNSPSERNLSVSLKGWNSVEHFFNLQ